MRRLFYLCLLGLVAAGCASSNASEGPRVEVIELGGLLDDRSLIFLTDAIEAAAEAGDEVAIVQINSPAVIGSIDRLRDAAALVADPPLPLVMWLGPAPARIGGGAAQLFATAPLRAAAPGTRIENWQPATAADAGEIRPPPSDWPGAIEVVAKLDGLVDLTVPSVRQLVQELDGIEMTVRGQSRVLATLTTDLPTAGEGVTNIPANFVQPGLWDRFLRLAARPEAAFFFLVAGATVAVFEMYAVGPGMAAAVASIALFLSAYGMSVLPMRWWAVAAAVAAIAILTASVQKGGVLTLTVIGTALLVWSGFNFTNGAPQVVPGAAGVIFAILAVLFFFLLAIPTVVRARFSTRTIGRSALIGRTGRALTPFAQGGLVDGLVEIDGARWPATAHREARIEQDSEIVVIAVEGSHVEVDPKAALDREN